MDLQNKLKPPPLVREHRLYQADWLLRFYGFKVDEIASDAAAGLKRSKTPSRESAERHRAASIAREGC